ncbi:TetR/AcrR family transcriptional regulator [Plantactinospora sp. S1510]|uniref:TetR/AcrR family transcriptional regulator n=1 Tax=Plantactinospora alkalitolerans TaxID=2789879 RepID=A0ABS0H7M0_9ACTN|nr:TetR/AcrR family transcriptional regulator [Plantactinospora alkalitolerans]MBF9134471.1 TetR/AcrR family transcriptional regulator [Plantactinospora alkalitolerans]
MTIREPRNERSRRTRAAILGATRALLEDGGLSSLTMAAVADRAEISRRAVYLHFDSRSRLLAALFDHVNETEGLAESSRPVLEAPDAVSALMEWADHLARYHPRLVPITRAIERARDTDPDAAALWDMIMADWLAACEHLADRLKREGRLAAPWTARHAADLLWALMSVDVCERLVGDRRWTSRRYGDRLGMLLRATLVSE